MAVASAGTATRPYTVNFPEAEVADLRQRLANTRFPEKETGPDQSQGTPLATLQKLVRYWRENYDFGRVEEHVNAYPNFIMEIDGLDIHFLHARSPHPDALPLIVTHGWPGSVVEQLKIIEPLTNPTEHGGSASDAFHVVIPSIPGYGFSGKPAEPGWGPDRIARAWAELMKELGYTRYAAHGGDWGAIITDIMGAQAPEGLIGIHTTLAGAVPSAVDAAAATGQPLPADAPELTEDEQRALEQLKFVYTHVYYAFILASRPQSMAALADSPAGLAAFLLDHDAASLSMIIRAFNGEQEDLTRDDVLDNMTLTWLTNTGVSSGRLYAENKYPFFSPKGVDLPVAVSVFPDEIYQPPKSWVEMAYPNLVHYNHPPKGGHFAAWEQPESLASELREGLRSLRK